LPDFDPHDEALVQELRDMMAATVDVPVGFAVAAKASFTWRTIDAELDAVSLCFDSAVDGQALVRASTTCAPRSLSFDGADIALEVEVRAGEISGRIMPAQPGTVRLRSAADECRTAVTDAGGWFTFEPTPHGPHRFECDTAQTTMITEWTLI
jgi:hypothetical protein